MLTVSAPAKINLTLEVLSRRSDGFHEIRSVIQTIDLCDRLHFESAEEITFTSDMQEWDAGQSLVSRAMTLFREATGCFKGVAVRVEKRIPLMFGLGGDSSDAVAVLLEGRGELVTPLRSLPRMWVVLAVPPVKVLPDKTKQLYDSLTTNHYTDGRITQKFIDELKAGKVLNPSLLFNTFENVAFSVFDGLDVAREHFLKLGAADVHLAGSGPVLFTMVEDKTRAEELYALLDNQRLNPIMAETLSDIENIG